MTVATSTLPKLPHWPGWRDLPRDARDTLFLLGVIAWTVLPHVPHLPVWCVGLTAVVLLWRARLALTQRALPGRWVLIVVLVLSAALTLWTHRTLLGKEPGVTMLVVLMALKTLELRARRDAFVVFFLGFFLVLTQFLYSQALLVALAMLIAVWGLLTALVLAHMPVGQPALRKAAGLSARCALLGAPIMALLFVLFPRIAPLWGVPQDGMAKTGLSNTMQMGSLAELASDDSIALRVRFAGGVTPAPQALYFRGPVLTRFDGREWQAARPVFTSGARPKIEFRGRGPAVAYEMTLEPLRLAVLPLLEATDRAPQVEGYRFDQQADLQWRSERPIVDRLRFDTEAHLAFEYGPVESTRSLASALELPAGANPRTIAWAAALRADPRYANASADQLANALMEHIRSGRYFYTLTPGVYAEDGGLNAIDEFWLDRRQGFCEHYAAAFVVAMRAMGVPARVVTGFQGADELPQDGYTIVRQSNAHAWAEFWQAGRGWVRADPTAAVAPERILGSRRLRPAPGFIANALGGVSPALLERLRDGWEAVNNRWNQWVLSYSSTRQFELLRDIGFQSPSWEDLALLLIGAISTFSLAGAAWAWWERQRQDPWVRQFNQVRRAVHRLGLASAAHEAPRTLAGRVHSRFGEQGDALVALLAQLELQRYGRDAIARPMASLTRALRREARQLERVAGRQSGA
jgi:transglutaminase-like putative cysteine protease